MRFEIVNEHKPESYTSVITCKVRRWYSFITGSEVTKEYLGISNEKTNSGNLEVEQLNKAPVFIRLPKREQDKLWSAVKAYRRGKNLRAVEDKIGKKYADYFLEPIKGKQNYRVNANDQVS